VTACILLSSSSMNAFCSTGRQSEAMNVAAATCDVEPFKGTLLQETAGAAGVSPFRGTGWFGGHPMIVYDTESVNAGASAHVRWYQCS